MKSLAAADRYGYERFVANQAYYSLIGRDYEWELMPLGIDQNVSAVVWSPLGWGRLTGKVRKGQPLPSVSRTRSELAMSRAPQALKKSLPPPNVPVPRLSAGTMNPDAPSCLYSTLFSLM